MVDPFAWLAGWLHENVILPVLFRLDWMEWDDAAFMWVLFAVYGVLQVAINLAVCLPAERLRPLQRVPADGSVAMDVLYTLIARVGIFPLVTFFGFYSLQTWLNGLLADHGYVPITLDRMFPVLMGLPVVTFLIYAVILDAGDYWRHRLSHRIGWWYGLHSVHHAQTRMTFWTDDRNHVLDDLIAYVWFIAIGLAIGIPPMQFPLLILTLRLVESLSHANTSLGFGWLGERLLVSPQFHRAHHGLLAAGEQSFNYGAVFPWWDMLLGTADFRHDVVETGDAGAPRALVSGSWWEQQVGGVRRAVRLAGRGGQGASCEAGQGVTPADPAKGSPVEPTHKVWGDGSGLLGRRPNIVIAGRTAPSSRGSAPNPAKGRALGTPSLEVCGSGVVRSTPAA